VALGGKPRGGKSLAKGGSVGLHNPTGRDSKEKIELYHQALRAAPSEGGKEGGGTCGSERGR